MSLQLIIYPQTYEGEYNTISTNPTEFIVNGINFIDLDNAPSYDSASILNADVLAAAPPTIVNSWYRFRYPVGTLPALPTVTSGTAVFNSLASLSVSGIYQRMSNLVVGQVYTVNINVSTTGVGSFGVNIFDGTTLIGDGAFTAASAFLTTTFTASAADNTFMFFYSSNTAGNVAIEDISIQAESSTPSITLSDGQVIVDLYEDEDIPLTLSLDNFKNVAEKVQSYSKAFMLPGTKRNNQIFDNAFEISRADDGIVFNPYKKTQSILKQDGFVLFEGYLRLIDIQDKDGEISYNVNLYSEAVAVADYLKEQTFSLLNFTELEHDYNRTQIKYSWNGGGVGITYTNPSTSGFRDANATLKYPFVNWNNQMLIANGSTGSNATENFPELTYLEQAFRPFIQIKYLIQRIFQGTPFTFTSEFFDNADFLKLYMDFNWGANNAPVVFDTSITSLQESGTIGLAASPTGITYTRTFSFDEDEISPFFGYASGVFTAQATNQVYFIEYNFPMSNAPGSDCEVDCVWTQSTEGGINYNPVNFSSPLGNPINYQGFFLTEPMQPGATLQCFITVKGAVGDFVTILAGNIINQLSAFTNASETTNNTVLGTLRGELNQWQFLKGIMTMFNLVTVPDKSNPNNILIEPYNDIFLNNDDSEQHDWTDKLDISEIKLTPLTELNRKTVFKFEEDADDFAFANYRNSVQGHLYGSKEYDASGFSILQGEEEIIASPFAATVPKPLSTSFYDFIVPAVYAFDPATGESSGFDNMPRIMYDNGIKTLASCTYYMPDQNGVANENVSQFLQFTHLSDIPTIVSDPPVIADTADYHFGECQLIQPIGASPVKNLFNLYWLPYFAELYNPDTRTMNIKVNLTPGDISTLNLFDTVYIKNRVFRINNIQYNPNNLSEVEFILIP
mgnify:FL=1